MSCLALLSKKATISISISLLTITTHSNNYISRSYDFVVTIKHRHADKQADRQRTDRKTDKETDTWTNKQTDRQTDKQKDNQSLYQLVNANDVTSNTQATGSNTLNVPLSVSYTLCQYLNRILAFSLRA